MKTKTKEQKLIAEKSALRQRIADIATGAAGYQFDIEEEFATADFLSRFIPALKVRFGYEKDEPENKRTTNNFYLFEVHNIENYNDVNSATEFLFEHGVRA